MPTQTTDLFLFEDLEDVRRTSELAESDLDALHAVAEWIRLSWPGHTRISAVRDPSVPSCLAPWNARHFGSLRSRSPTGACHSLSSL